MKKTTSVLLAFSFLLASILTAGFFNTLGNQEFYAHSLMTTGAKFFVDFEYGKVTFQSDPNNLTVSIDPYPIQKNAKFEKSVVDYFKAQLGDAVVDAKEKASAVILVKVSGKSSIGTETLNNVSYNKVFETVEINPVVTLARSGLLVLGKNAPEDSLKASVDRGSYESKGQLQYPKFASGIDAMLSSYVCRMSFVDTMKSYASSPALGNVSGVIDEKKKIVKVDYASEKKVPGAYKFVVMREKAADVPETDWVVETTSWEMVAILGIAPGPDAGTYSCKIQKIKAGMTPADLQGLRVVLNGGTVRMLLNAQDLMTGKDNWK
jgi:hypothetical protein